MVQLKRRVGRAAHDAQCLAAGIGEDKSPDLGRRGHGAADKIVQCRVEEFIATVADCIRNESGLIDGRIKVPPQRHLLYGKRSRDEAGGELLHDGAAGDPVHRHNQAGRQQYQQSYAQHQRRHQCQIARFQIPGCDTFGCGIAHQVAVRRPARSQRLAMAKDENRRSQARMV